MQAVQSPSFSTLLYVPKTMNLVPASVNLNCGPITTTLILQPGVDYPTTDWSLATNKITVLGTNRLTHIDTFTYRFRSCIAYPKCADSPNFQVTITNPCDLTTIYLG